MMALFLFLVACDGSSTPSAPPPPDPSVLATTNPNYRVRKLFEVDGCTVYRFSDADKYRYFTRCVGASTETLQGTNDCRKVAVTVGGKPPITTFHDVCEDGGSIPTEGVKQEE